MRIYIPYTEIQPETVKCLEPYGYNTVRMVDDDSYLRYFQQRWADCESFISVEHDTLFRAGAIEELTNCPEEWCAFGVMGRDVVWHMDGGVHEETEWYVKNFADGGLVTLALVKFERSFIKKYPDLWDEMPNADVEWKHMPKWVWCDSWLNYYMRQKEVICHQHYPEVFNANPRYYGGELPSLLENWEKEKGIK